jgi:hypothetical protein
MLDQVLDDENLRKLAFSSSLAVYGSNTRCIRLVGVLNFTLYLASTARICEARVMFILYNTLRVSVAVIADCVNHCH